MVQETDVERYLQRAHEALRQAEDKWNLEYYDVATSRDYYAMFYATSALLASQEISRSKHSGVH